MKRLLALLIACLALTIAACGDDDDDDGGGGSSATTPAEQTDTGTAPSGGGGGGETAEVDIPDISFEPKSLTVKAGTTVTWTNSDDVPHTVTAEDGSGAAFDSGNLATGDTFEQTFDAPGTVDYVCTIHPGQEGSVTVE